MGHIPVEVGINNLTGSRVLNMDGKGRVAIPAKFREILAALNVSQLWVTNSDRCLDVYTPAQWDQTLTWLNSLPNTDEDVEAYRLFYVIPAQLVDIDKQGRVLIPPELRQTAELDKEVMVTGDGEKIQIWNKATWDEVFNAARGRFRQIKNNLAQMTREKQGG